MKKIVTLGLSSILATFVLTGCGIKTSDYNVSADNVNELRKLNNIKIAVSPFTAIKPGENSILCRLADTVETSNNESFEKYIENAFIEELKMANIYDSNSEIKISGKLKKIEASTIGSAYWLFDMTVSSSNGESFDITSKREYGAAFLAYTACMNMGTSFAPSVKQLISEIITHSEFKKLLITK